MLENKMKMFRGFMAGLMVAVSMIAFMPSSEAAITFPGRAEQQQTAQTQDRELTPDSHLDEMEADVQEQDVQRYQAQEEVVTPQYASLIAKVADPDKLEIYPASDLNAYFQKVELKHKDKFYLYCSTPQEALAMKQALEKANFKVEDVKGKNSEAIDEVFSEILGSDDVWGMKVTYKDPNHKGFWDQIGWQSILSLGLGLL